MADLAASTAGAIVVPVYSSNSPDECEWVLGDSGSKVVICENAAQVAKIDLVRGGPAGAGARRRHRRRRPTARQTMDEVAALGRRRRRRRARRACPPGRCRRRLPDHLHVGYHGASQGCRADEPGVRRGPAHGCRGQPVRRRRTSSTCTSRSLTCSPSSSRRWPSRSARRSPTGVVTPTRIVAELGEVQPDVLPSVPRIFEKVYASAMAMIPPDGEAEVAAAIELGNRVRDARLAGDEVSAEDAAEFERVDAELFPLVRGIFGGKISLAISGAAPIAPEILRFFYACGVPVMEGWGMTETTGLGNRQPPRGPPLRHHRAADRGSRHPHRRRRRDRDRRRLPAARVLEQPGGDRRGVHR